MRLIGKFNKGFRFLLSVIDIFSKYAWIVPLNYKKGVIVDDVVSEYNNTFHRTIKMRSVDLKDNKYVDSKKDPKFKVRDHVRISKYKNIFAKRYMPNWSEQVFLIKKVKITVPWTYVINDLNGKEIIGTFYEKELQKTNQKEFRRKCDKLYVKWKGYNNSFNSWIDKKDLV